MKPIIHLFIAASTLGLLHAQGDISPPPGAPAPNMKTLTEIWSKVGVLETQLGSTQAELTKAQADLTQIKANNQLLTGLLSTSPASLSLPWNIVTVEGGISSFSDRISLVFNPEAQPAMVYPIGSIGMSYASYNGTAWQIDNHYNDTGFSPSVAFAPAGYAAISYSDGSNLYFSSKTSGNWGVATIVDSGVNCDYTSLAYGPGSQPAIAYYDRTNTNLKFASYNGSSWSSVTVDNNGDVGGGNGTNSLVFGPDGRPAIAYPDSTNQDLKFARYNGASWTLTTVDSVGSVGSYASLKFGPDGQPAIAYYDGTNGDLKLARYNGSTWALSTVESAGVVGNYASLAFGPDGQPAIAYRDETNFKLRFTRYNGSTWTSAVVDNGPDVGRNCALSFGPDGQPAIAYRDSNYNAVKFARKGVFKPAP